MSASARYTDWWNQGRSVSFGSEDNHVVYDVLGVGGVSTLTEQRIGTTFEFAPRTSSHDYLNFTIQLGDGNDEAEIVQTTHPNDHAATREFAQSRVLYVYCGEGNDAVTNRTDRIMNGYGESGNDTLRGGSGYDELMGDSGDDLLFGGDGDDVLRPGSGHNTLDGGAGLDTLWDNLDGSRASGTFILTSQKLVGPDADSRLASFETAGIWCSGSDDYLIDASRFGGPVALYGSYGSDTLIGSPFDDAITDYEGHDNLVIGGGGADSLWIASGNDVLREVDPLDVIYWIDVSEGSEPNDGGVPTPADDVISVADMCEDNSLSASPGDDLLIGQGIATVGIEDREFVELDTASSDSAFGELADSEPEDGDALAANGDTNSADVGEGLELDAALSDELLASLTQNLRSGANL